MDILSAVATLLCMKRERLLTSDGSYTVAIPGMNVTYHSTHGAVQESRHVFIEAGLNYALSTFDNSNNTSLRIFEMGFGTGLNALLSFAKAKELNRCINYQSAELYPLSMEDVKALNYISMLGDESLSQPFIQMHKCEPGKDIAISPFFTLHTSNESLLNITTTQSFHLIYFDAFAPDIQPELWTQPVFKQMYNMLCNDGALVTYCSKGTVRRAMQAAGFTIEKLKGPPGKREIVRALKR